MKKNICGGLLTFASALLGQSVVGDGNEGLVQHSRQVKLSNTEVSANQSMIANLQPGTVSVPSMKKGGLVTEREVNGYGYKVFFVTSLSGNYIFKGVLCGGEVVPLGSLGVQFNKEYEGKSAGNPFHVFDSENYRSGANFSSSMCSIQAFRITAGTIEGVQTIFGNRSSILLSETITFSPMRDKEYTVYGRQVNDDTVLILGRSSFGRSVNYPLPFSGGSSLAGYLFPVADTYLPPTGPTTVTLCSFGDCQSLVYDRKFDVNGFQSEVPTVKGLQ